jgi:serine/threonine protein phosphatase PrpC
MMNARPGIKVASLTDIGRQRENNEDSYLYWEPASDDEFERKGRLAIVADGMGGYEGGLEASRLAVETVRDVYDRGFSDTPQAALLRAFSAAHERIQNYAEQHPEFYGMGTTCTAFVLRGRQVYFAHIGDSRLYVVRGTGISQLTRDHSYVGRLVASGIVRSEDAETHPQRHILTAALGVGEGSLADSGDEELNLENGDALVLCTDGLWSLVSEQELEKVIQRNGPSESCDALVTMALARGGADNITVQVLRLES